MERFSNRLLLEDLWDRVKALDELHKFDRGNGWKQVEGKPTSVIHDYGVYRGYLNIIETYN